MISGKFYHRASKTKIDRTLDRLGMCAVQCPAPFDWQRGTRFTRAKSSLEASGSLLTVSSVDTPQPDYGGGFARSINGAKRSERATICR